MSHKKQKNEPRATRHEPRPPLHLRFATVLLIMLAVSFALYGNSIHNGFVFDDLPLVVDNRLIETADNLPLMLGVQHERPAYRPVRYLSYMIDYALSGKHPECYHISNIIYHAVTAWLVFLVLGLLTGSRAAALAGALLFVAHPVHTDSVAYISGRRDVLSALFYLLGFYWFVRYRQTGRARWFIGTCAGYLLALGSKEMAVTLPVACLLYDTVDLRGGQPRERHRVRRFAPYIALGIGAAVYLYYKLVLYYPSLRTEYYGGSALANFATVLRVIAHYVQLLVFPIVLQGDYSYNGFRISESLLEPAVLASAALYAAMLVLFVRSRTRRPLVFLGGMWFLVTLLPVCQIFPHHELLAEHYLYLPSVGAALLAAAAWPAAARKHRTAAVLVLAFVLAAFAARTVARNRDWKDEKTFWSSVLATAPECARAHDNLGTALFNEKDYRGALEHHQAAVRIRPDHGIFRNNLGMTLGALGRTDAAETHFEKAIKLNPALAAAYNNLGIVYYRRGRYREAGQLFKKSHEMKPDARAALNAGRAALKLGYPGWAAWGFRESLRWRSNHPQTLYLLGMALTDMGEYREARRALEQALALRNDYAEAWCALGRVCLEQDGDAARAMAMAEKSLTLKRGLPEAFILKARVLDAQDDVEAARSLYAALVKQRPDDAALLLLVGRFYREKLQDMKSALWYLERALDISEAPKTRQLLEEELRKCRE